MQRGRYLRWVHAPSWLYASVPVEAPDTQMGNIDQTFTHAPHDDRLAHCAMHNNEIVFLNKMSCERQS